MGAKHKDNFEFLPPDDPEARSLSTEIIGYLFGYPHFTNTRSLALLGTLTQMHMNSCSLSRRQKRRSNSWI